MTAADAVDEVVFSAAELVGNLSVMEMVAISRIPGDPQIESLLSSARLAVRWFAEDPLASPRTAALVEAAVEDFVKSRRTHHAVRVHASMATRESQTSRARDRIEAVLDRRAEGIIHDLDDRMYEELVEAAAAHGLFDLVQVIAGLADGMGAGHATSTALRVLRTDPASYVVE